MAESLKGLCAIHISTLHELHAAAHTRRMKTTASAVPLHISRRQFVRTSAARLALSTLVLALIAAVCTGAEALDFGDRSAATITGKAWAALDAQSHEDAIGYA